MSLYVCLTAFILKSSKLLDKPVFLQFPSRGSLELCFETQAVLNLIDWCLLCQLLQIARTLTPKYLLRYRKTDK